MPHPAVIEAANLDPILRFLIGFASIASISGRRPCRRGRCLVVVGLRRSRQPLNLRSPRFVRPCQSYIQSKKVKKLKSDFRSLNQTSQILNEKCKSTNR